LLSAPRATQELEHRPSLPVMVAKTVLSAVNLDAVPRPRGFGWAEVLRVVVSALVLAAGAALAMRGPGAEDRAEGGTASRGALARFALAWAIIGWVPLFLPSIGWHAYYGCVGALGAWFLLALGLEARPRIAVAAILGLALLRGARANTLSWDWGNEWYQRRAGRMLSAIHDDLLRRYPTLPPHSRVFLGHIPNNIGLIAGQSPALRVWYRDTTLQAGFYSYYRPRPAGTPRGEDYFFVFDPSGGLVEVRAGPEDVAIGLRDNPQWEDDHEKLAMLFLQSDDVPRAAVEFEKLATLPQRPYDAAYAAVCREAIGDSARADSLSAVAAARMGLTVAQMKEWEEPLRQRFRGP
jgi:hypothetical protein